MTMLFNVNITIRCLKCERKKNAQLVSYHMKIYFLYNECKTSKTISCISTHSIAQAHEVNIPSK
jgi:hypothetical protein